MLWWRKCRKLFHCLDDISLVFASPSGPPTLSATALSRAKRSCLLCGCIFFPFKGLLVIIPPGLGWYAKMSSNRSPLRLHYLTYWLRQWRPCADMKLALSGNTWQYLWISVQCQILIQVSRQHVIRHCTTHAMLNMTKCIQKCVHVRAHAHAKNIQSQSIPRTCMFSYLLLWHAPVPSCSRWGYIVYI